MIQPSRMLSFAACVTALLMFAQRAGAQNYVTPVVQASPPANSTPANQQFMWQGSAVALSNFVLN